VGPGGASQHDLNSASIFVLALAQGPHKVRHKVGTRSRRLKRSRRADLLKNGNGVFNGELQTPTRLEMKQMAACRRGEGGAARRGGAAQGDAFVL
jgi:hypothetical protein